MKIFFIIPYPLNESPSQRFRFEQYFDILTSQGYSYNIQSFHDSKTWRLFFKRGHFFVKSVSLLKGFLRRFGILFSLREYDFVFIHREALPIGPPILEWIIANVLKSKIIYDFDDAIWLTDRSDEARWFQVLKWRSKVRQICRWSYKVSCGNNFLASYARQFNNRVVINPSTIDTQGLHNRRDNHRVKEDDSFVIGWTGSHSTLKYLETIEEVLGEIEREFPSVKIMVIGDRPPDMKLSNLIFKPWNIATEIQDLSHFDVGIMPLPDDEWSKGKCGFKALQYMALEIPAVVSPVGANLDIIKNGETGFFASTPKEWKQRIVQLIQTQNLISTIGKAGRQRVINQYSVVSNARVFLSLFDSL